MRTILFPVVSFTFENYSVNSQRANPKIMPIAEKQETSLDYSRWLIIFALSFRDTLIQLPVKLTAVLPVPFNTFFATTEEDFLRKIYQRVRL